MSRLIVFVFFVIVVYGGSGQSGEMKDEKPDIIRRLRTGVALSQEEQDWVDRVRTERRISKTEFADHLEKCWRLSEEYEQKNIRYTKTGKKEKNGIAAIVERYNWLTSALISIAVGLVILTTVFIAKKIQNRKYWRQHDEGLLRAKTASELVSSIQKPPFTEEVLTPDEMPPE